MRDSVTWFLSYLTDRAQRVVDREKSTNWITVTRGVPQGSGLSPLLFNIFVRELPTTSNSDTYQFADDITLAEADADPTIVVSKLTTSFSTTKQFCEERGLIVNVDK